MADVIITSDVISGTSITSDVVEGSPVTGQIVSGAGSGGGGGGGSGDALTSAPLSQFAATTSLQLKGVMTDETGSGSLVFGTSPTLVTPALGTPASGVATNLTGTATGLTAGAANAVKSATTSVDTSAATAPTAGQSLIATDSTHATWKTTTTYFNVKTYGATGDGSTDDTTAINAAITAAKASNQATATVYFPAGKYLFGSTLNCSTAAGAGGRGLKLRGDGIQASLLFKTFSGVGISWDGSSDPNTNPSVYGGIEDMTIEGNNQTGTLVHTATAQQMLFRGCKLQGASGRAFELVATQDSWFVQVMINNCGTNTLPAIDIYGTSVATSNMLWFNQVRVETFIDSAIWIKAGSGQSSTNNGFYFNQCKFESVNAGGDVCIFDNLTEDIHIDDLFMSVSGWRSGFSTAVNFINSRAINSVSYRNIYVNAGGSGLIDSVINIQCQTGYVQLANLYLTGSQPVTSLVTFASNSFNTKFNITNINSSFGDSVTARFVYLSTANTTNTFTTTSQLNTVVNGSVTADSVTTTGNIELGNASDTTIARASAGVASVEGNNIVVNTSSPTLATITTTGNIELGNASDTTLSRSASGVLAVEGVVIPSISSTNTLTNKRVTKRTGSTTSSATPTINTDNVDMYLLTAQTVDITSFTSNLSGTPTEGQTLIISITGTAARAITWGTSFESSTVTLPTTTVTTNRLDVGFIWNTVTSKWRCVAVA